MYSDDTRVIMEYISLYKHYMIIEHYTKYVTQIRLSENNISSFFKFKKAKLVR